MPGLCKWNKPHVKMRTVRPRLYTFQGAYDIHRDSLYNCIIDSDQGLQGNQKAWTRPYRSRHETSGISR